MDNKDKKMVIKKGQVLDLDISGIAFGGKGIARVDGFTIFVDGAVPMDRVNARIVKKKKNYAEARLISVHEPAPYRIESPCKYSGFCGGCKWQAIDYQKQLEFKRQHVEDSLKHIGGLENIPVHPTIPSDLIFGYRNKMEFSCSDRRWLLPDEMGKNDIDSGFALGLHVPGTFYKVLDTDRCLLQPEFGNTILNDVRTFMKNSGIPVYGLRSHTGFWRFLMLRYSVAHDQWMVNIITASEDRETVQPLADFLMKKYPRIVSIVNNITSRKAGVAVGEYEIQLAGNSFLKDKIGRFEFTISANSFFQTNTSGAEKLYKTVQNFAGLTGTETVLDLYSGTGTIPIVLSETSKKVIGIEIVESAVSDAEKNCQQNNVTNCSFIQGDISDQLSRISEKPDVLIIDPPRVGMHKNVVRQVLNMGPERMVYVSCNPATLSRDLGIIKDDYRILEVQPVDMFPHTYHIESVTRLERK